MPIHYPLFRDAYRILQNNFDGAKAFPIVTRLIVNDAFENLQISCQKQSRPGLYKSGIHSTN